MRGPRTGGLTTLFLVIYPVLAVLVVTIGLAGWSQGLRGWELFNDPAHEVGVLWGIFSYFGILLWAAATACCAIAWIFLARTSPSHPLRRWFAASALLSGALAIDDTFLIHDVVLPEYAGIPQAPILIGYSAAIGWYLVRFRGELLDRPDSAVFLASLLFLGLSLGIDLSIDLGGSPFPFISTIEDLAKLLGITAWTYSFARATLDVITRAPTTTPTRDRDRGGATSAAGSERTSRPA